MCEPVDLAEAPRIWQNNVACYQGRGKDGSLTDAVDNDGETPSVPEHLSDLFQRSSHLLNLAKRSQLAQLLIDFADVFAVSSDDLSLVIPAWSPTRLTLDLHILSVSQRDAFHHINALKPTHCSRTRLKREGSSAPQVPGRHPSFWARRKTGPPVSAWTIVSLMRCS